jgi:hypothetical protein
MDLTIRADSFQTDDQSWLGSEDGTRSPQSGTLRTAAFTKNTHYPNGYFPSGIPLAKYTSGPNIGLLCPLAARPNEVQTVTISGTPTGGTFTLTLDGETTGAIAYNATATTVKTALEALSNVTPGDVVVTGGPGPGTPYVVTFSGGTWAGKDVPALTAAASLTGGSSPAVAVATSTGGGSGVSDGSDVLYGFLFTATRAPWDGTSNVLCAVLERGRIRQSRLPIAVTATQQATNPLFRFVA